MEFDVVEELKNFRFSQEWIKSQLLKYEELREQAYSLKSPNFDGMPKALYKVNYFLEELMDKYTELIDMLVEKQKQLNKVIIALETLEPIQKTILSDRYIIGLRAYQIARKRNYSERAVYKIIRNGLEKLEGGKKQWENFWKY